ncbi:uncharacterized protein LOC127793864 isoform X2 [Diospyros lotus]|uniref:uncharacterized protein LOC127793864 isoform X2 n=1 Tax=Diospyros lotus TaxID=55363 RepID=UPI00224E0956|nr:uncharacterized protein LOC127793864 isoform X2 [Diospyros lotus]
MAATLIDSQKPIKDDKFNHVIGENYELALSESIQTLLDSKNRDSSAFASTFYELMQARDNPPLESIWFYSALTYRCNHKNSPGGEPSRVSATKDLFQLISSCSASSTSSRSIGLLAPVIYEAYRVLVDLKSGDLSSKRESKIMKDIKSLVDAILGFISVCCSANDGGLVSNSDGFFQPLEDLIRIWIGEASEGKENFELFFPLLGDDIVGRLSEEGTFVGELAGAVITEAFLLKLCLYFCSGVSKQELQKEPRAWAVSSITGFRNFYFFETLVGMLLEPNLPVTSILSSEDEVSLRNVLYDAIVLVEYSFFNFDEVSHLPNKRVIRLAIARVIVTHEATESFRVKGDQTKAISYINAFSGSQLPAQLVKLVTSEIGMDSKASQPKSGYLILRIKGSEYWKTASENATRG